MVKDPITISIIVDYVYIFTITFMICLMGSFVRDAYDVVNYSKHLNLAKMILSSIFVSFVMCAIYESISVNFSLYIFLSFILGMWGIELLRAFTNVRTMLIIVKNIFKAIENPISKGIANSLQEFEDKNMTSEIIDKNKKDDINDKDDKEEKTY